MYEPNSPLWQRYPEFTVSRQAMVAELGTRDRPIVRDVCFRQAQVSRSERRLYLATAGAPAAGKSTILEQEIAENPIRYRGLVRADPDVYAMNSMVHTYHDFLLSPRLIAEASDFASAQRRAYDIARPWSNVLTSEIFNEAIDAGYSVAHGTTMTSASVDTLLGAIKNSGREVHLLLCYAPDSVRVESAKYRATVQANYQVTAEDALVKGMLFPQRFASYFMWADRLTLFWRTGVTVRAQRAAIYGEGKLQVEAGDAFEQFRAKYAQDCASLSTRQTATPGAAVVLSPFSELEARYFSRF